jgi:hypothetical protein
MWGEFTVYYLHWDKFYFFISIQVDQCFTFHPVASWLSVRVTVFGWLNFIGLTCCVKYSLYCLSALACFVSAQYSVSWPLPIYSQLQPTRLDVSCLGNRFPGKVVSTTSDNLHQYSSEELYFATYFTGYCCQHFAFILRENCWCWWWLCYSSKVCFFRTFIEKMTFNLLKSYD